MFKLLRDRSPRSVETRRDPSRIEELETQVEEMRRELARLRTELAATNERANAALDLTEQRIDLIHAQVVHELRRAFDLEKLAVERETEIDRALARTISGGLAVRVEPADLDMAMVLSNQLSPGRIRGPLTLYGFRLNRRIARETGEAISVAAGPQGGAAVYGPYKRLVPGRYEITAVLKVPDGGGSGEIALDVFSPGTGEVSADRALSVAALASSNRIALPFEWTAENAREPIEIRLHQRSDTGFTLLGFDLAVRS